MHYVPHLPTVHVELGALRANYRLLASRAEAVQAGRAGEFRPAMLPVPGGEGERLFNWPSQAAVVKADAYGHGHIETSAALMEDGARLFCSGTVPEAAVLREGLAATASTGEPPAILSLLGVVTTEDVDACVRHGIISLLHCFEQIPLLAAAGRPVAVAVKYNTGMSRLGFIEEQVPRLLEELRKTPLIRPVLVLSHLAKADSEEGREEVRRQGALFARMVAALRAEWPDIAVSFGNSAGSLLGDEITALVGAHICRLGVSLYGTNPLQGTSHESLGAGLRPAMSVSTPIITRREIAAGEGVSYGHTFVAGEKMNLGIAGIGYADFHSRGLSNKGVMCVEGVRAPIVGRVCMQMVALDLGGLPKSAEGKWPLTAWVLGGPHPNAVTAEELAALWGTITYEVFCLLGTNERRFIP